MTGAAGRLLDVGEIARMLDARVETVVLDVLPDGRRHGHEWVARCPWRIDKRPGSFLVHLSGAKSGMWHDFATKEGGDTLDLVAKALFGGDKRTAIRWALRFLGLENGDPVALEQVRRATPSPEQISATAQVEAAQTRGQAFRIWLAAEPRIADTPVDHYLRGRGIHLAELSRQPRALRYHPALWHRDSNRKWPAMVALIAAADGKFAAVHRTWLEVQANGSVTKAPLGKMTKMTLGEYSGGSIRLWRGASKKSLNDAPEGEIVDITEGIEDGLSVACAVPESRVLAAVSLANIANVALPAAIKGVRLWRQNDTAPETIRAFDKAACAHLVAGRDVFIPPIPDDLKDVNDLMRTDAH